MTQGTFFKRPSPVTLADLATLAGAQLADPSHAGKVIAGGASLDRAGPGHLTFCENKKYTALLEQTHAGACLVNERMEGSVPPHVAVLRVAEPYKAFVTAMRSLYPDTLRPASWFDSKGVSPNAVIHSTAYLEDDVVVDPLAVIGPDVEIGSGTVIGAGAVIGAGVRIGRDCHIGANASVLCAFIGNDVIIHPGCRIGQDGFGYLMGARGHQKVPQAGRVIIQNGVEIGAGCTIDRGALNDTVIGEGSKIDNLVQIGHNVVIGKHCIIVAATAIAGSAQIGDYVVIAAQC
ncbi:MAG: UDP-3-O-(3-hydroxymyristoyl)glucosamine N-acyltransferase, partial [Afipia sp.]